MSDMDRRDFIKLGAAMAALFAAEPGAVLDQRSELTIALGDVAFPALRYHIPFGNIERLADTGTARKYLLEMHGRSGVVVKKYVLIGTLDSEAYHRSDLAYQIVQKAKEARRDIAHHEGIDWRANEYSWRNV